MLSLLQTSLRYVFDQVIVPDAWTLSEPTGLRGTGQPNQSSRWVRTMQEVPVLSQRIKKLGGHGELESDYVLQYRSTFRFPGNLRFDQLPIRTLTDISEYLVFLIQTHPDLLTSEPSEIARMVGWVYPHVDPCLYPDPPANQVQDKLSVTKLSVNGFIPIVEMDGSKDWLVILVWSVEVCVQGSVLAYRRYFQSIFNSNQINIQPNLTGGRLDGLPWQIGLSVYDKKTNQPAYLPHPKTIDTN